MIGNAIGKGGKAAAPTHLAGRAANAALMPATAGLTQAYAGLDIRVIGINPGLTRTDRVAEDMQAEAALLGIGTDEAQAQAEAGIPLGRTAGPHEVAATVVLLASARARYVTGITVTMEGAKVATVV